VVTATRTDARRGQRLAIGAEFNAIDRRVIAHVTSSQGNFVRDEYGRRIEGFGEEARRIVATGLEEGLGRDDITQALEQAARACSLSSITLPAMASAGRPPCWPGWPAQARRRRR
jgi:hypothetical protein